MLFRSILSEYPDLDEMFDNQIVVKDYDINEWVEYAKSFAKEQGYIVDELGTLALYARIDEEYGLRNGLSEGDIEDIMELVIKKASRKMVRRGFFAALKIENPHGGAVKAHEKTLSKPKADRLSLLKAVKANLSPIFLLFNDDNKKMVNLCKTISKKKPTSVATDKEKTAHKLWVIDDEKIVKEVEKTLKNKKTFIADGHHRYETSWNYLQYIKGKDKKFSDKNEYGYVLAYLCPMEDSGISIWPTHRVIEEPKNLEEQAISLVGTDIYEKLIKGYTQKQWGRPCTELPSFIIKRLPVRLTFDNNYFNALYQGIPVGGYTKMIENILDGIEIRLGVDYLENREELDKLADKVVYTGAIDAYFEYKLGTLEYRSVRFETELLDKPNFQGNAAVNYTDAETPWTRIIEHKWFEFGKDENGNDLPKTVISREYSSEWKPGDEPYYPVNDDKNSKLYAEYKTLADKEEKVIFGGRLGEYKYYDMDTTIAAVLDMSKKELF
mgnify:CR=1 FL=1